MKIFRSVNKGIGLVNIIKELKLNTLYITEEKHEIMIRSKSINRPGLNLIGFFDNFDPARIQVIGRTEFKYLESLTEEDRKESIRKFFAAKPVTVMLTSSISNYDYFKDMAQEYKVPLLKIEMDTSDFMNKITPLLNIAVAPYMSFPGGLLEVHGEGIIILGESGIGKSETAVELIKRGHCLIADDVVRITKVSHDTLIGDSVDNIRYYLELRGIGIINARTIYGVRAIKEKENINLIIKLTKWEKYKCYDRLGLKRNYTNILDIHVPVITIPVSAGRTISAIVEVAAMNHRQIKIDKISAPEILLKELGYNANLIEETFIELEMLLE